MRTRQIKSGARRLLRALGGGGGSNDARKLTVFITNGTANNEQCTRSSPLSSSVAAHAQRGPDRQVAVVDLLTRCGVRTATGMRFVGARCDPATFGWCLASEQIAGCASRRAALLRCDSEQRTQPTTADV